MAVFSSASGSLGTHKRPPELNPALAQRESGQRADLQACFCRFHHRDQSRLMSEPYQERADAGPKPNVCLQIRRGMLC
jgi:hypothetical protein